MFISSRSNDRVKAIRALRDRKARDATGTFFAEGPRLLQAAVDHAAVIEQVIVAPDRLTEAESDLLDAVTALNIPMLEVSPEVFDSVAFREESQSLGAVVRQKYESLAEVAETKRCWVALPEIQHPGNLGTVIRCCDAVGGDGVILVGQTTDPYHPIAVRGTLGAIFSQRIVRATDAEFARWVGQRRLHGRRHLTLRRPRLPPGRLRHEARRHDHGQ